MRIDILGFSLAKEHCKIRLQKNALFCKRTPSSFAKKTFSFAKEHQKSVHSWCSKNDIRSDDVF